MMSNTICNTMCNSSCNANRNTNPVFVRAASAAAKPIIDFTRSGWRQFFKLNRSLGARFIRGFVLRYELAAYLTTHEAAGAELDEGHPPCCRQRSAG